MSSNANDRAMNVRLCGLGFVLLAVGIAAYGGIGLGQSRIAATARWPKTSGRIVSSEVGMAVIKTGRVRRATDVANIYYTYTVDGREFKCDGLRVVPMFHPTPEGTAEELVRRYPVGRRVDVYYDPSDPSDALLTPVAAEDALRLIQGAAFVAPCVALVGLLLAGIGGLNLTNEARPAPATTHGDHAAAPVKAELAEVVRAAPLATKPLATGPAATRQVEPRATHWLVRMAAVLMGLFLMLFGGPMSVTIARMSDPKISVAVKVISLMMVGGAALFGAFLIYVGMRKARRASSVVAAG